MANRDFLTVAEAAAILGVPGARSRTASSRALCRASSSIIGLWLIPRDEVERWKNHPPLPRGKAAQRRRLQAKDQKQGED